METMIVEKPRTRRRWWLIALIVVGGIAIIANSGGSDTAATYDEISNGLNVGTAAETPAPVETDSQYSVSEQNAIEKADSYLGAIAFSRSGLIGQLVDFEGFSTADATLAVDSLNVDWNEQAAKKAESYLDAMAFSRTGLIDQLVDFEGFTAAQAAYGVGQTGL